MGGVTTTGYPYVTPTDHPKEFPAHSQALANKLEADDTWVQYTPTVAGATVQTAQCFYLRTPGGLVTVDAWIAIGSVTGNTTISVPFPPLVNNTWHTCSLEDVGTTIHVGAAGVLTTSGGIIGIYRIDTATHTRAVLSATAPFTWATGDTIHAFVTYRAAPPHPKESTVADTYLSIAGAADSFSLQRRVSACAAQQDVPGDPQAWTVVNRLDWASAPGWGEAFAYAEANGNEDPGADEAVITDAMILSQVQSMIVPGAPQ